MDTALPSPNDKKEKDEIIYGKKRKK